MCGVFGAISLTGAPIRSELMRRMALDVQTRGRHAHGVAWATHGGALRHTKAPGPIADRLDCLDVAEGAAAIIGHCRYATQGEPRINCNNHPHRAHGGLIVHNGRVPNYADLILERGLAPETDCDTEAIGLMVEQYRGSLLQRIERSVHAVDHSMALLGLWVRPLRLAVVRRGRPLYGSAWDGVWYFSSLPWALPRAKRIRSNTARVMRFRDGRLLQTIRDLRPAAHEEDDPTRRGTVTKEYGGGSKVRNLRWWLA